MTNRFKKRVGLKKGQAPLIYDLKKGEMGDFYYAIHHCGLRYNGILTSVNLTINKERYKWEFLDCDKSGKFLIEWQSLKQAASYLTKKILTNNYKIKYNLGDLEAPITNILRLDHGDFFSAFKKRNLKYNDILMIAGYIPHIPNLFLKIGSLFHWIGEYICLKYLFEKDCCGFFEVCTNIKTSDQNLYKKFGLRKIDLSIILDDTLRSLSRFLYNIPKNIILVNIDFFLGSSKKKIKKKCLKGYQGKGKMLILVPLSSIKPMRVPSNIPYPQNVKVLDPTSFCKFFGFDLKLTTKFLNAVELARKSTYLERQYKTLEKFSRKSEKILKRCFCSQNELLHFIQNDKDLTNDLLKYIPDKNSLDYW